MPEPGMGSAGSRSGTGMGGGGGYAGPDLDWGMGPEGSEGTEVSSRSSEDRDFDDVSPLAEKQAFMQAGVPSSPSVLNLQASSIMSGVSIPSLSGMKQFYLDDEQGKKPAMDPVIGFPKNLKWGTNPWKEAESMTPWLEKNLPQKEVDRLIDVWVKAKNEEGFPRTDYSNVPKLDRPIWEGFPQGKNPAYDKTFDELKNKWEMQQKFPGNFYGPQFQKIGFISQVAEKLRDAYYRSSLPKTYSPMSENLKNPEFYGWLLEALADMKRQRALSRLFGGSNENEYTGPPIEINLDYDPYARIEGAQ